MTFGSCSRAILRAGIASATLALGTLASPTMAQAQEAASSGGLEEIVVTAQRREERLQDVPIAIAAVTAESLRANGVDNTRDLPQIVPSVQFTRSGASGLFFVRGVGTTNAAVGEEGANAVYVDDVYLADLSQTINNFNNIARIEVLKGPQGTLFGRNATGGLIHIITREPGDEAVIDAEGGFANYETFSGRLYAATPLGDNLSADIALTGYDQDKGHGRNLTVGKENKLQNYWGARSKWVLRASDTVKLTLIGDYNRSWDNLGLGYKNDADFPARSAVAGVPSPTVPGYDALSNKYPSTKLKIYGVSLKGEVDLGFADLTSVSAYRRTRNISDFDVDGTSTDFLAINFVSGTKSFQQEIRLASNSEGPLKWQVGAFYLHTESANDSFFTGLSFAALGAGGKQHIVANLNSNSYAAFAELTYDITPTTHLTGGIRYTQDKRHFVGRQFNVNNAGQTPGTALTTPSGVPLAGPSFQDSRQSYDAVTWRVALRQEITPDISVYATANKGFKSGSYSLQSPTNDPYRPQTIMAYEAGIKSELLDRRLRLNAAYFHYDIDDYQIRSAAVTPGGVGTSVILNAAKVKVDGVDLEFEAAPTDELRLFGGFTWLDSRYAKFGGAGAGVIQAPILYLNPATCPLALVGSKDPGVLGAGPRTGGFATCFGEVTGLSTMNAPDFTASVGASYTYPLHDNGSLRLSLLYNYNSGYVFDADNKTSQPSYDLVNMSMEYRPNEHFGVEVWGRNIFDTEYAVQKIASSGISVNSSLGAPATYGITFKVKY